MIKLFNDITIYFFQIFQDLLRIPNTFQSDIITAVIALFVVIDPIGNLYYCYDSPNGCVNLRYIHLLLSND